MVIFRENTEDIYAGIEFLSESQDLNKILDFIKTTFPDQYNKIRFPQTCGIGIKPISKEVFSFQPKYFLDLIILGKLIKGSSALNLIFP